MATTYDRSLTVAARIFSVAERLSYVGESLRDSLAHPHAITSQTGSPPCEMCIGRPLRSSTVIAGSIPSS